MFRNPSILLVILQILPLSTLISNAHARSIDVPLSSLSATVLTAPTPEVRAEGYYEVMADGELSVLEAFDRAGSPTAITPGLKLPFYEGDRFDALELRRNAQGELVVELARQFVDDQDESDPTPTHITVRLQDLAALKLREIPELEEELEQAEAELHTLTSPNRLEGGACSASAAASDSDEFEETQVAGRGHARRRGSGRHGGCARKAGRKCRHVPTPHCYRRVKSILRAKCGFKGDLPGEAAIDAVHDLTAAGFSKISDSFFGSESMGQCTVCILSGSAFTCHQGKIKCGDAVVKIGGWWEGAKRRASPDIDDGLHNPVGCFKQFPKNDS